MEEKRTRKLRMRPSPEQPCSGCPPWHELVATRRSRRAAGRVGVFAGKGPIAGEKTSRWWARRPPTRRGRDGIAAAA